MIELERNEADIKWTDLWNAMKTEWFKLEVLQDYSGEDESDSLSAWIAGDKAGSIELLRNDEFEWAKQCRAKTDAGVRLIRIHIVEFPLTPYLEWEIEAYKARNIPKGGEEVYLLDAADIDQNLIPSGDIMIFDTKYVVSNTYAGNGKLVREAFYDQDDDITNFLSLRSLMLESNILKLGV